jgi:hypothetical protein
LPPELHASRRRTMGGTRVSIGRPCPPPCLLFAYNNSWPCPFVCRVRARLRSPACAGCISARARGAVYARISPSTLRLTHTPVSVALFDARTPHSPRILPHRSYISPLAASVSLCPSVGAAPADQLRLSLLFRAAPQSPPQSPHKASRRISSICIPTLSSPG